MLVRQIYVNKIIFIKDLVTRDKQCWVVTDYMLHNQIKKISTYVILYYILKYLK